MFPSVCVAQAFNPLSSVLVPYLNFMAEKIEKGVILFQIKKIQVSDILLKAPLALAEEVDSDNVVGGDQ